MPSFLLFHCHLAFCNAEQTAFSTVTPERQRCFTDISRSVGVVSLHCQSSLDSGSCHLCTTFHRQRIDFRRCFYRMQHGASEAKTSLRLFKSAAFLFAPKNVRSDMPILEAQCPCVMAVVDAVRGRLCFFRKLTGFLTPCPAWSGGPGR